MDDRLADFKNYLGDRIWEKVVAEFVTKPNTAKTRAGAVQMLAFLFRADEHIAHAMCDLYCLPTETV